MITINRNNKNFYENQKSLKNILNITEVMINYIPKDSFSNNFEDAYISVFIKNPKYPTYMNLHEWVCNIKYDKNHNALKPEDYIKTLKKFLELYFLDNKTEEQEKESLKLEQELQLNYNLIKQPKTENLKEKFFDTIEVFIYSISFLIILGCIFLISTGLGFFIILLAFIGFPTYLANSYIFNKINDNIIKFNLLSDKKQESFSEFRSQHIKTLTETYVFRLNNA